MTDHGMRRISITKSMNALVASVYFYNRQTLWSARWNFLIAGDMQKIRNCLDGNSSRISLSLPNLAFCGHKFKVIAIIKEKKVVFILDCDLKNK